MMTTTMLSKTLTLLGMEISIGSVWEYRTAIRSLTAASRLLPLVRPILLGETVVGVALVDETLAVKAILRTILGIIQSEYWAFSPLFSSFFFFSLFVCACINNCQVPSLAEKSFSSTYSAQSRHFFITGRIWASRSTSKAVGSNSSCAEVQGC